MKFTNEPSIGSSRRFWYDDRLFLWYLYQRIIGRLYCFSDITTPIKSLFKEARELYEKKTATKSTVRRSASSHQWKRGGNFWTTVAIRPSGALYSVIIEEDVKKGVKADPPSNTFPRGIVSRIFLSGSLNVIDGVAVSEGRTLVMITSNASQIDKALP